MNPLKIAASAALAPALTVGRDVVALDSTDFTDVAAVVVSVAEARSGILGLLRHTGFSFRFSGSQPGERSGKPAAGYRAAGRQRRIAGAAGAGCGGV